MAQVVLERLEKSYGDTRVVRGVDLHIHDGEFVALLGPSGCGKTTTLRMIAGLEEPTGGRLRIGDEVVSEPARGIFVPPERRRLGMVFQSYAVWPHKSVAQNVEYPLALTREPDRPARVAQALALVQLAHLGNRMPNQLSGGQQQRVALARALVMRPRVLLLDEPLSNLDAHLRVELREQIAAIRADLGVTVVYVTHDQEEALALADRIVVMDAGTIAQADTPRQVYDAPASRFVAAFIGKASFLTATLTARHDHTAHLDLPHHGPLTLPLPDPPDPLHTAAPGATLALMIRPDWARLTHPEAPSDLNKNSSTPPGHLLTGLVERVIYLGDHQEIRVRVGEADAPLKIKADTTPTWAPGDPAHIEILRVRSFPPSP